MIKTKLFHYLAALAVILQAVGCAAPTPVEPTSTLITPTSASQPTSEFAPAQTQLSVEIDKYLTALVDQGQFSGSLLVAKDGTVLLNKGYGMANWELQAPNTPQTKFRLGSITKQFTAMAILQLQQQGALNVQDLICQYIQDCPEAWQPITVHQLLTHTSGIYNFTASANYAELKKQFATPLKLIDQFRNLPLDFVPGERWRYSNSGYIVLGYIIEQVSGQAYADFLQANIFEPLQMADTGYADSHGAIPHHATGYLSLGLDADYIDMSVPYAAGGLYSTVKDMFLWDQALSSGTLLSPSLQNEMFTPFVPIPAERSAVSDASYGYGWRIGEQFDHLWVAHGGGVDGFAAKFDRYPDDKLAIIVLSNFESARVGDIALEIARMNFEAK